MSKWKTLLYKPEKYHFTLPRIVVSFQVDACNEAHRLKERLIDRIQVRHHIKEISWFMPKQSNCFPKKLGNPVFCSLSSLFLLPLLAFCFRPSEHLYPKLSSTELLLCLISPAGASLVSHSTHYSKLRSNLS